MSHRLEPLRTTRQPRPAEEESDPERFVDSLLDAGSVHEVEALLLSERGRAGSWHQVAQLVGEALVEIGRRWADGLLAVIDEHIASDLLWRALARQAEAIPVPSGAPAALLATVEGDEHTLGLSLVELCLREAGFRTRWAGRAAPLDEITRFLGEGGVELLAVSASSASVDAARLAGYVRRAEAACDAHGVQLLLGGAGCWPEAVASATRVTGFADLWTFLQGHDDSLRTQRIRSLPVAPAR